MGPNGKGVYLFDNAGRPTSSAPLLNGQEGYTRPVTTRPAHPKNSSYAAVGSFAQNFVATAPGTTWAFNRFFWHGPGTYFAMAARGLKSGVFAAFVQEPTDGFPPGTWWMSYIRN